MLTAKKIEVGGATYIIGQVPADKALDIACVVMEWRGKVIEAAGSSAAASDITDKLREVFGDEKAVASLLSAFAAEQVSGLGRTQQVFARMWRDREYRDVVFRPLFEVCTRDGQPVLGGDWQTYYVGDKLGELVRVHTAAVEHNCSGFLSEFTGATPKGAAGSQVDPPPNP